MVGPGCQNRNRSGIIVRRYFKPRRWLNDSTPYHYVLGEIGAMVVTAERDDSLDKFNWKADPALAIGAANGCSICSASTSSLSNS